MSIQFVYGKAGTGKSQFCLEKIKEYINKNNLEDKIFLIVPEQFSYATERRLLEILENNSVINAEIISFKRIADRVFKEVGGASRVNLSKAGKAMILNNILANSKTTYLGKSSENVELATRTITELKKHNISGEMLQEQIDKNKEDVLLKTKLEDICNIYKLYNETIENNFIDEDDVLTLLAKRIESSKMFENSYVFIDEFAGFTPQEYLIIEKIMKKAEKVYVTVCTNGLEKPINPDLDIFYSNKKTVQKIIECANKAKVKIDKPIELSKNYRFKNDELRILEENLYGIPYKTYNKKPENIYLNLYKNPYDEIENIAKIISSCVRNGYRYRDIAVITKNLEDYSSIAKVIFEKYDIPVYIDEKSKSSNKILIKYVLSILDIFAKNWSNEAVWAYIKSGFLDLNKEEIYLLENYCKKWGIKRGKWYESDWKYGGQEVDNTKINEIRRAITEPLRELQFKISESKTVKDKTKLLFDFLEDNQTKEKLNGKIEYLESINQKQLANEYKLSWDLLIKVLDEMVLVFENEKVNFEEYRKNLKTGLEFSTLGTIPQGLDQVILGDSERSRTHKIKVMFVLGINDGVFPGINKNEGFLNDEERRILKDEGIEIANGTLENIYEDQFNIYKAFSTSEEKIYLSYIASDKEGKAKRASILINRLKKIFIKLQENVNEKQIIANAKVTFGELLLNIRNQKNGSDVKEIWKDIYNWYLYNPEWKLKLNEAERGFNYKNISENITKENIDKLYGTTLKTSVSRLEQYKRCPFSFYLKYALRLNPEEEYSIRAIDTGSFMHSVIDAFFERNKNIKQLSKDEMIESVNCIVEEKLALNQNYIFSSSTKFIVLTNRLKKVILQSIEYIVEQIKNSSFETEGHEVEFVRNIENVQITGKIDRIDSLKAGTGKYIRIIDYKSSERDINLNELMSGTGIQLITYLDSITDKKDTLPAGMLYFNLIDPIVKSNKNLTDEEIKNEIRKSFKMKGMILADIDVIKEMDKSLEEGYSETIPVYIGKDGTISKSKSNIVTKEQFTNLQKTARKIINKISSEILSGNIDIVPVYNKKTKTSSCKFCEYKSICQFNPKINKYNYIENKAKEQILDEIKEEI